MGGDSGERELRNALTACGWPSMRAPASGRATTLPLPDVLAGQASVVPVVTDPETGAHTHRRYAKAWAIEHKTVAATTAYYEEDEVEKLTSFAYSFGAIPVLSAKFKSPGGGRTPIYLVQPDAARVSSGETNNLGIPEVDAEKRAFALVYPETKTKDAEVELLGGGPEL